MLLQWLLLLLLLLLVLLQLLFLFGSSSTGFSGEALASQTEGFTSAKQSLPHGVNVGQEPGLALGPAQAVAHMQQACHPSLKLAASLLPSCLATYNAMLCRFVYYQAGICKM